MARLTMTKGVWEPAIGRRVGVHASGAWRVLRQRSALQAADRRAARRDEAEGRQRARALAERHLDAAPGQAATMRRVGEHAHLELVDERLVGVGAGANADERGSTPARRLAGSSAGRESGWWRAAGRRAVHALHRADHDADGAPVAVPRIRDDPCAERELVGAARLARTVVDRVAQLPRRPGGRGRRDRDRRRRGGRAGRSHRPG